MKKDEFQKNFSDRICHVLAGKTQVSISKEVGYSQALVSKYMVGKIPDSFVFLAKLAETYGVDLHQLLTGQPALLSSEIIDKRDRVISVLMPYFHSFIKHLHERREQLLNEKEALNSKHNMTVADHGRLEIIQAGLDGIRDDYDKHWRNVEEVFIEANRGAIPGIEVNPNE